MTSSSTYIYIYIYIYIHTHTHTHTQDQPQYTTNHTIRKFVMQNKHHIIKKSKLFLFLSDLVKCGFNYEQTETENLKKLVPHFLIS